jgi:hypothetical protein
LAFGKGENYSKILVVACWISRMMMWHTGESDRYFKNLSNSNNKANNNDASSSSDKETI